MVRNQPHVQGVHVEVSRGARVTEGEVTEGSGTGTDDADGSLSSVDRSLPLAGTTSEPDRVSGFTSLIVLVARPGEGRATCVRPEGLLCCHWVESGAGPVAGPTLMCFLGGGATSPSVAGTTQPAMPGKCEPAAVAPPPIVRS